MYPYQRTGHEEKEVRILKHNKTNSLLNLLKY